MAEYTKRERIMKYTETVYYIDGKEVDSVRHHDDWTYDEGPEVEMSGPERRDFDE